MPFCKDGLVSLPINLARSLSNITPLALFSRIGNCLQLIDPTRLQSCEVTSPSYWRTPFDSPANVTELVEFTAVLEIEPSGPARGNGSQWMCRSRSQPHFACPVPGIRTLTTT